MSLVGERGSEQFGDRCGVETGVCFGTADDERVAPIF